MRWTNNLPSRLANDDMPLLNKEVTIGCLVHTNSLKCSRRSNWPPQSLCPTARQCGPRKHESQETKCFLRAIKFKITTVGNLTGRQFPSQLPEDGHGIDIWKIEYLNSKSNFAYRRSHERIDGARREPPKTKMVVHAALRFLCNNVQQWRGDHRRFDSTSGIYTKLFGLRCGQKSPKDQKDSKDTDD